MPLPSGAWLNIFTNLVIDCDGKVGSWEFYAKAPGTFMAGIWRPIGGNRFRFIGANTITVATAGAHIEFIAPANRIMVEAGDIIGVHYPAGPTVGVVPYSYTEGVDVGLGAGVTVAMLSPIHNEDTRDDSLVAGTTVVSGLAPTKTRLPALAACIVKDGGFGDPHILASVAGIREPLCYTLYGNDKDVVQLIHDPESGVDVNGKLYQPGGSNQTYFNNIAILTRNCRLIASLKGISVNRQAFWQWNETVEEGRCGSASYSLQSDSHLVVRTGTGAEFVVVLERRHIHGRDEVFLDFFLSKRDGLSDHTTGLIGQFNRMDVSLEVTKAGQAATLTFPSDPTRPQVHARYQHKRSVLQGPVGCWFVGHGGAGLIQGAQQDYTLPHLTWTKTPKSQIHM